MSSNSKVYLYDTTNKKYHVSTNMIVLNPLMMDNLFVTYADDLEKGYGDIEINPETLNGTFVYYTIKIKVDEENNPYEVDSNSFGDDVYIVKLKDYKENIYLLKKNFLVKYFDNNFHTFEIKPTHKYNPKDNTYVLNFDKYKEYLIYTISNCENEVRRHGYFYNILGNNVNYVQPFRESDPNDIVVYTNLKNEIPVPYRRLHLFTVDKNGNRLTTPGSYKILYGDDIPDELLDFQILTIQAYSGYLRDTIVKYVEYVKTVNNLRELELIRKTYVTAILKLIEDGLNKNPEYVRRKLSVELWFKQKNVTIRNNVELPRD